MLETPRYLHSKPAIDGRKLTEIGTATVSAKAMKKGDQSKPEPGFTNENYFSDQQKQNSNPRLKFFLATFKCQVHLAKPVSRPSLIKGKV